MAPMPEYPDAATTYAEFRDKIRSISEELAPAKSPAVPSCGIRRGRQLLRTVLVAAVLVACLFSGMVVAQASGLDVLARLRAGLPCVQLWRCQYAGHVWRGGSIPLHRAG